MSGDNKSIPREAVVELLRHVAWRFDYMDSNGWCECGTTYRGKAPSTHEPDCLLVAFCERFGIELEEVEGG